MSWSELGRNSSWKEYRRCICAMAFLWSTCFTFLNQMIQIHLSNVAARTQAQTISRLSTGHTSSLTSIISSALSLGRLRFRSSRCMQLSGHTQIYSTPPLHPANNAIHRLYNIPQKPALLQPTPHSQPRIPNQSVGLLRSAALPPLAHPFELDFPPHCSEYFQGISPAPAYSSLGFMGRLDMRWTLSPSSASPPRTYEEQSEPQESDEPRRKQSWCCMQDPVKALIGEP